MADVAKITNVGLKFLTALLLNAGTIEPKHIGWGIGTVPVSASDVGLAIASAESRVVGTTSQQTTVTTDDTYRVVGEISSTTKKSITEIGLFNNSENGTMLARATFSPIDLEIGDSIQFTTNVVFDQT